MKKLTIGIDLDSTLNNLLKDWLKLYNLKFNDNLCLSQITDWDLSKVVKPECGKAIYSFLTQEGLFENLEEIGGACDFVRWLNEEFDCYIVTAYFPENCMEKVSWIKNHLPAFPTEKIMFVNNKQLVNLDVLIDDGKHNFSDEHHKNWVVVKAPYNERWITEHSERICYVIEDWEKQAEELKNLFCELGGV